MAACHYWRQEKENQVHDERASDCENKAVVQWRSLARLLVHSHAIKSSTNHQLEGGRSKRGECCQQAQRRHASDGGDMAPELRPSNDP